MLQPDIIQHAKNGCSQKKKNWCIRFFPFLDLKMLTANLVGVIYRFAWEIWHAPIAMAWEKWNNNNQSIFSLFERLIQWIWLTNVFMICPKTHSAFNIVLMKFGDFVFKSFTYHFVMFSLNFMVRKHLTTDC